MLLPDTQSSVRWEQFDRKYLDQAFTAAGVKHTITNAQGDPTTQRTQAEQALTNGAKVILLVDLDPGSGKSIISLAHSRGAKVIDYDRLTLGGGADYYVSFDNEGVGKLQGQGLVKCIKASGVKKPIVAELNGSPDGQQRDPVRHGLQLGARPEVRGRHLHEGPEPVGPGLGQPEGADDLRADAARTKNKIEASLAANDGLANSVISAETARKLQVRPGHRPGRDGRGDSAHPRRAAVHDGLQGREEGGRRGVGSRDRLGEGPDARWRPARPPTGARRRRRCCSPRSPVTKDNIKDTVIADGFLTKDQICVGAFAQDCTKWHQ